MQVDFADSGPQLSILFNTLPLGSGPFQLNFTDSAFAGLVLTPLTDSFANGGLTNVVSGSEIIFTWSGVTLPLPFIVGSNSFSATFDLNTVPEPSSTALLAIAFLAMALSQFALRILRSRYSLYDRRWRRPDRP